MEELLKLFNGLEHHFFIINSKDRTLVFMNDKAKQDYIQAGYDENTVFEGRTCHEIMCNSAEECPLCHLNKQASQPAISTLFFNPCLKSNFWVQTYPLQCGGITYHMVFALREKPGARPESLRGDIAVKIFQNYLDINDSDANNPNFSIDSFLSYIGAAFSASRTAIDCFDEDGTITTLHEWRRESGTSDRSVLKAFKVKTDLVTVLKEYFGSGSGFVYYDNMENFRRDFPMGYSLLGSSSVKSIAFAPIYLKDSLWGFFSLTDAAVDKVDSLHSTLKQISTFIVMLVVNSQLYSKLGYLSYRDQLTDLYNRHAMQVAQESFAGPQNVGIIYCDITGLKPVNDSLGHEAGDKLILSTAHTLRSAFYEERIYRIGGDEFLLWYKPDSRDAFIKAVSSLKDEFKTHHVNVAVGSAYRDNYDGPLSALIAEADKSMYDDKKLYYTSNFMVSQEARGNISHDLLKVLEHFYFESIDNSDFSQYIRNNYYSSSTLFQALTHNSLPMYTAFGDLKHNLFYVSDRIKKTFGTEGNLISDLFNRAEQDWLATDVDRKLFRNALEDLLKKRKTDIDLYLRVHDVEQNILWMHWHGVFKWSDGEDVPIFYAGFLFKQDESFVIDPTTHLPKLEAARLEIVRRVEKKQPFTILAFTLGNFRFINDTRGRDFANRMVCSVIKGLSSKIGQEIELYRLEGLTFAAIMDEQNEDKRINLLHNILRSIRITYQDYGISTDQAVCSALLSYPNQTILPHEILDKAMSFASYAQNMHQPLLILDDDSLQAQQRHFEMMQSLKNSISRNFRGFSIRLQPIVKGKEFKICAAEAVLYFSHMGINYHQRDFLPILTKSNLYGDLVRYYLKQCAMTCHFAKNCLPNFRIYTSAEMLADAEHEFLDCIDRLLNRGQIESTDLCVQIPGQALRQKAGTRDVMIGLRNKGVRVCMDNFGEDDVNLAALIEYQCEEVKLCAPFAFKASQNALEYKLLKSLLFACREFGKTVHITGISSQEILNSVCFSEEDLLEGPYFYQDMELKDLFSMLSGQDGSSLNLPRDFSPAKILA